MVRSGMRFEIEPEYILEEGCRCLSCFEHTGKWLVRDMEDKIQDVKFNTEDAARAWVREFFYKRNYEIHNKNTEISKQDINNANG